MRGRLPKPSAIRKLEGNPGHRSLPANEPQYPPGLPEKPKRMSLAAKRVWDELVDEMAGTAVLRRVDKRALWQLCEDEAILTEVYESLWKMAEMLKKKAEAEGKALPAGPLAALLTMSNGRLAMAAIRDLAARTIIERREFGLTPSARTRLVVNENDAAIDPIDDAVFNRRTERLQ
jgi:P27 family predicted phage terminase small subunit